MRSYVLLAFVILVPIAASELLRGAGTGESDAAGWQAPPRAARKQNPIPADDKSIAAGKKIYSAQCVDCHGPEGHGDGRRAKDLEPSPEDLTAPAIAGQSDGALFWKISEGRKPMPTFEKLISEDDRWNVVNYLRTLSATPSR
jgi:mono/diheme cytochrome c family protein